MKKFQIHLTTLIILLYALLAPIFRPTLDLFWVTLGTLLILALLAKNYLDILLLLFTGVSMVVHTFLNPNFSDSKHILIVSAMTALIYLHLTLLIGPLVRLNSRFAKYFKHRKHIGVSVFFLGLIHASFVTSTYYKYNFKSIQSSPANFFGITALLILTTLAPTSISYLQQKLSLKVYSIIHSVLLLVYVSYVYLLHKLGLWYFENWQLLALLVFIIFWIAILPWGLPKKIFNKVNGWKQFHYLVYISYLAIVIHGWMLMFVSEKLPLQIFFWGSFLLVIGVHGYGWYKRLKKIKPTKAVK